MATTPHSHPDLYTSILLGTTFSPGTVKLSGFDREHEWETQNPKGTAGESTLNRGPKNSGFTAEFYLVNLEQVSAWDDFQRLIASTVSGPKPKALSAYHPDLVRNLITDVVVKKIGGMQHDAKGGMTVVVEFLEYKPPKPKAPSKPSSSGKNSTPGKPDPNAEAKRELAALLEQAKAP